MIETVLVPSVRGRFPPTHVVLLDNLDAIISALEQNSRLTSLLDLAERGVPLFNSYVAFAIAVYMAKFRQLYESIAESLNYSHYLIYAQSARSILENTATVRYYSRHSDLIAIRNARRKGPIPIPVLEKSIATVDRLVRGNRFSWQAFVSKKFDELSNVPDDTKIAQVHVQTCLDNWYKESPQVKGLYDLLCEFVHPNLGSNLTVIRAYEGRLAACGEKGEDMNMFVAAPTLAGLVGAYRVVQESLLAIEGLKVVESNHP